MKRILCTGIILLTAIMAFSQAAIQGRVIDRVTKEPLELAYIRYSNGNTAALTNKQGYFSLNTSSANAAAATSIVVSFIGYETQTISISERTEVLVEMEKGSINLQEVVITPQSTAQSFHTISRIDLNLQPVRSAQDILRTVPGLFIGQHQGGGKSEQIFLRGFDIDHGTDINVTVDGLPVNMVSHAHGQGYADLHFLIPELTAAVDYGKGPYYTKFGNMGTAGYVSMNTVASLDKSTVKAEVGQFNTMRGLAMIDLLSKSLKEKGTNAYVAGEFLYSDGPFKSAQHFNRFNIFGKLNTQFGASNKFTLIGSALNSGWDASGQVPDRAVKSGMIGRFGFIDDTEGGYTGRVNASATLTSSLNKNNSWENRIFYSRYHFNLHSNFTFFLDDPVNGDQIRQREGRNIFGYQSNFSHEGRLGSWDLQSTYGVGFRLDRTKDSELSHTINRNTVLSYTQLGDISEDNLYAYADQGIEKGNWLVNVGIRFDHFNFRYKDKLVTDQLPARNKSTISPKVNIQYTVSDKAQVYLKGGKGFHSNDARVVVFNMGEDVLPAAYGADLGVILKPVPKMLINVAAWYLYLQQEFVYVGDEGIVEPSGKTKRMGIDLSARYQFTKWLFADFNGNLARPRSIDDPKGNDYIPLAPGLTSTGGISVQMKNGFNGSLRYRYIKDRAANEQNSVTAKGYTVADLSLNYTRKQFEIGLAIENLFDVKWNETQFDTESRLKNEPDPVSEIHFTPGVPFFARMKFAVFF